MNNKKCTICGIEYPATTEYFHKSKSGKYGIIAQCKGCRNKIAFVWHSEHYLLKYGITVDDWNKMCEEQEGKCGICGIHQSELNRRLQTDHDHDTGIVRGLLCINCNVKLDWCIKQQANISKYLQK